MSQETRTRHSPFVIYGPRPDRVNEHNTLAMITNNHCVQRVLVSFLPWLKLPRTCNARIGTPNRNMGPIDDERDVGDAPLRPKCRLAIVTNVCRATGMKPNLGILAFGPVAQKQRVAGTSERLGDCRLLHSEYLGENTLLGFERQI